MADNYSAAADLEILVKTSNDETVLECLLCCETFTNKEDLIKHGEGHNRPQNYQCKICYKYFSIKSSFKNHAKVHKKRDKVCHKCGKGFRTPGRLKSHIEVVHGESRIHKCPHCSKAFTALISLEGHLKNSHRLKQYTCTACDKKFAKKYALAEHLATIHSTVRSFHCDICNRLYATKRAIRFHITKIHIDQKNHKCPYCDKFLATRNSLNTHVRNIHKKQRYQCELCKKFHEGTPTDSQQLDFCPHIHQHEIERYHCQICNIKYRTRNELKSHNFSVHKDKKHLCDECGQIFDTAEELSSHTDQHDSEKKYMCDICGNKYRGQTSLKRHRLNHFEKQFQCPVCSRKFTREYLLRLHMPQHTNERNIQCSQCPSFFRSWASRRQHELLKHRTKAEFNCKTCGKTFNVMRVYKHHMQVAHSTIEYQCDICKKKLKSKLSMKYHINRHMENREEREQYIYSCGECSQRFLTAERMKNHMCSHIAARPFRCNICEKSFRRLPTLQTHSKTHVKKQSHLCEQCGYVCYYEAVLENHIAKYHSTEKTQETTAKPEGYFPEDAQADEVTERFPCEECHRDFESLALLQCHKKTHLYECATCKQDLRTEKLLSEHIKKEHRPKKHTVYKCNLCDKEFKLKDTMKRHLTKHEKQISKEIPKRSLVVKRQLYTLGNSFKKVTKRSQNVSQGRKKVDHTDDTDVSSSKKQYQRSCNKCDLVFYSDTNWKKHRQEYHSETIGKIKRRRMPKKNVKNLKENFENFSESQKAVSVSALQNFVEITLPSNFIPGHNPTETLISDIVEETPDGSQPTYDIKKIFLVEPKNDPDIFPIQNILITTDKQTELTEADSKIEIIMPNIECDLCTSKFTTRAELKAHYDKVHLGHSSNISSVIQCQRCDKDFYDEDEFIVHMKSHDVQIKTLHRCLECNRTFEDQKTLDEHKVRHLNENVENFSCPICEIVFKSQKGMKIHLIKIHKHWKCRYCELVLSTDHFQKHLLSHVTETVSKMDIDEMNKTSLETNVESEESYLKRQKLRTLYHCPYCDFSFTMFKNFNAHLMKIHQSTKCRPCDMIISLDKLSQHNEDAHKTDKTFKCTECNDEFSNFNKLYYHRRSKHMYRCPECVMMYLPTLEMYKEHLKSHGLHFNDEPVRRKRKANVENDENNVQLNPRSGERLTCAECGKMFATKVGLKRHIQFMFKPKPRWQKVIFRCDPPWEKCKYCKNTFKHLSSHIIDGICPEKRKKEREKEFEQMRKAIECQLKYQQMQKIQVELMKLEQKKKAEMRARNAYFARSQRMKYICGYESIMGKPKEIRCRWCRSIFYHEDSHKYHLKYVCVGRKDMQEKRIDTRPELKEIRILIKKMSSTEILKHSGENIPSALKGNMDGKRLRRPPKCFCCKGKVCQNLIKPQNDTKWKKNVDLVYLNTNCHTAKSNHLQQEDFNEESVLEAMDIKIESENVSDPNFLDREFTTEVETEAVEEQNNISYTDIEFAYERELETAMENIKEQFGTFNRMIENNYNYYNKTWAKAGSELCTLETAKKAQNERTWNYICHQIPVQLIDITKKDDKKNRDKQYSWKLKCDKPCPPTFVEETIKTFQDFFDSWQTLVQPFLTKQEVNNFRKELIGIELQADIANNLSITITVCNQNASIEKAFQYYFTYATVNNINNITYRNIAIDENGKTSFRRNLIFGKQLTEQVVCGIKVRFDDFKLINQLSNLEIMSRTIENYLNPNVDFTLLEIGCRNGFIGLSLSSKYKEVIAIDNETEINLAKSLCEYNDITNVFYEECTSTGIKNVIECIKNESLHAIVNVDIQWVTNLHIMQYLRNLSSLKSIVLITSFSPKVYLPISELITADPTFFGYSFVPVRSCVVDKMPGKHQFEIVMLLLREDVYEQKPVIKVEPIDASYMVETTLSVNDNN